MIDCPVQVGGPFLLLALKYKNKRNLEWAGNLAVFVSPGRSAEPSQGELSGLSSGKKYALMDGQIYTFNLVSGCGDILVDQCGKFTSAWKLRFVMSLKLLSTISKPSLTSNCFRFVSQYGAPLPICIFHQSSPCPPRLRWRQKNVLSLTEESLNPLLV